MSRSKWKGCRYENASTSRHGLMVCNVCSQSIDEGDYRCRETEEAYITQHRACSQDDPQWAVLDRQRANHAARQERLAEAATAFIEYWGVVDLSEYAAAPAKDPRP
ncbi:hypothetical protein [Aurantimonas endophytica]|uniref:Uncharacterized protein n=1 Tax=Aurantimonas endophytica TaxID=1522175 RepID=A0A7W6HFS9_9HYPH|nr:hypothetical protein [Aurantimonas endophytica]MBB4004439.1 hypothetical protein [Aurantimonas endophytica]MCO6405276.1 hypothetical protein [Aurantimonas endophytica]